jgi:hypothetical protein
MAALPKYKRSDLDYNGLPAWLFQGTPASFEEEILKQGKFDENKAQLDASEKVRQTIGNEQATEEEILKAISAVSPAAALDVLKMRDDSEDDAARRRITDIQQMQMLKNVPGLDPNSEVIPEAFRGLPPEFYQGEQKVQKVGDEIVSIDPRTGAVRPLYKAQSKPEKPEKPESGQFKYNEYGESIVVGKSIPELRRAQALGFTLDKMPVMKATRPTEGKTSGREPVIIKVQPIAGR